MIRACSRDRGYLITARYQKSDGTWKEVRTAYKFSGKVLENIQFGIPGQGVFQVDKDLRKSRLGIPMEARLALCQIG